MLGLGQVRFDSATWQLPKLDHDSKYLDQRHFSFDFVSPRLQLNKAAALTDFAVSSFRRALRQSPCNFRDRLQAFREVAHDLVLFPEQLRSLLKLFPRWHQRFQGTPPAVQPRVEAFCLLYNRTLYHSEVICPKLMYDSRLFPAKELDEIRSRFGVFHSFDALNLHDPKSNGGNRHGPLNLEANDGWVIAKLMLAINQTEKGEGNFTEATWPDRQPIDLPGSWSEPPHEGELTLTWTSQPDEISLERRKELASKYLGWTFR